MTAIPEASTTTTDLLVVLTRVETKLDISSSQLADHEVRIRSLERSRWPLPTIGVLAAIAATVISLISIIH